MARSRTEENRLPLSVGSIINYTCSNATEVAQIGNFELLSTTISYEQRRQRRQMQLSDRYPPQFSE